MPSCTSKKCHSPTEEKKGVENNFEMMIRFNKQKMEKSFIFCTFFWEAFLDEKFSLRRKRRRRSNRLALTRCLWKARSKNKVKIVCFFRKRQFRTQFTFLPSLPVLLVGRHNTDCQHFFVFQLHGYLCDEIINTKFEKGFRLF